jgi:hypothetical protein
VSFGFNTLGSGVALVQGLALLQCVYEHLDAVVSWRVFGWR